MSKPAQIYVGIVAAIGLFLIVISVNSPSLPGPPEGLTAWTIWGAEYVALVISAQKLWQVGDALIKKLGG